MKELLQVITDINEEIAIFREDSKKMKNKSATLRCRKATLKLERLGKKYRQITLERERAERNSKNAA